MCVQNAYVQCAVIIFIVREKRPQGETVCYKKVFYNVNSPQQPASGISQGIRQIIGKDAGNAVHDVAAGVYVEVLWLHVICSFKRLKCRLAKAYLSRLVLLCPFLAFIGVDYAKDIRAVES